VCSLFGEKYKKIVEKIKRLSKKQQPEEKSGKWTKTIA
jgi:hypothetical protein